MKIFFLQKKIKFEQRQADFCKFKASVTLPPKKKKAGGSGAEMALQWGRTLGALALAGNLGSVPRSHVAAQSHLRKLHIQRSDAFF